MTTASHQVEALSPEAFASIARGPFPCAHGTAENVYVSLNQGHPKPEMGSGGIGWCAYAHDQLSPTCSWSSQPPYACKRLFIPADESQGLSSQVYCKNEVPLRAIVFNFECFTLQFTIF